MADRDQDNYRDQDWRRHERNEEDRDWARQVNWERGQGPYRDYGWERGQSELPEFRDPSVHVAPYERSRVDRWRQGENFEQRGRNRQENGQKSGPYAGIGPRNYTRSDERISEDVCETLMQHGQIDAREIQVNVKEGQVTLEGSVDSRRTRRLVEDVIDDIRGVKDIHNNLRVDESRRNTQRDESEYGSNLGGGSSNV